MAELNQDDSGDDEAAADLANLERFISEDTSDGIINADTFKDLISEIHDLPPEFLAEIDFEDKSDFLPAPHAILLLSSSSSSSSTSRNSSSASASSAMIPTAAAASGGAFSGGDSVDSIVSRLKQEEVEAADREIQAAMLDIGKSMSMNSGAGAVTPAGAVQAPHNNNGNNTAGGVMAAMVSMSSSMSSSITISSQHTMMTPPAGAFHPSVAGGVNSAGAAAAAAAGSMFDAVKMSHSSPTSAGAAAGVAPAGGGGGGGRGAMAPFGGGASELSPAALTLKQMAEQHQHKAQMGIGGGPMAGQQMAQAQMAAGAQAAAAAAAAAAGMRMPLRNYPGANDYNQVGIGILCMASGVGILTCSMEYCMATVFFGRLWLY